jgi:hypothetical protein
VVGPPHRVAAPGPRRGRTVRPTRGRAAELACDADLRLNPPAAPRALEPDATAERIRTKEPAAEADPRLPVPGTVLTRAYKGSTIQVKVLARGFEYGGEVYGSLSAVAKAVIATESLHGESQARLDLDHRFDAGRREVVIDASTDVGRDLSRLFVGFVGRELGRRSFLVEGVAAEPEPATV